MPKHNNAIADVHLRKHWMNRVRTWFNQPARKLRRRENRQDKAEDVFPRPINSLRPVVNSMTLRYKNKRRFGRGFSLQEIKQAGLTPQFARTVGIAVDHRRYNKNKESIEENVRRLEEYKNKLILFPRKKDQYKKGIIDDSTKEKVESEDAQTQNKTRGVFALPVEKKREKRVAISDELKNKKVYQEQRLLRTNKKHDGPRRERARRAAMEE